MSALRPATLDEYVTWLRAWLDTGHQPTHAYDYPWSRWTWLTASRDFTLGGECGANAVHIIVPAGIRHAGGGLGHNQLYFADGPGRQGRVVPVFSDPQFQALPGVPEFLHEERRKLAAWRSEVEARKAASARAMQGSDVGRWMAGRGAGPAGEGPDCRRCGKPTGKWWLSDVGTDGEHRMLCASCDAADMERALGLPATPAPSEETSG